MVILAQLSAIAIAASPGVCSIGTSFGPPPETTTVVVAVATGEFEVVSTEFVEGLAPPAPRETIAHRFRVARAYGPDSGVEVGETFLVVPWGYNAGCEREVFEDPWVPPGDRGLFRLEAGRVAESGEPLFDQLGWHAPYPHGAFLDGYQPVPVPDRAEWLSADELFDLMRRLPRMDRRDPGYGEAIGAAFNQLPAEWSRRFPGSAILRIAELISRGGVGGDGSGRIQP